MNPVEKVDTPPIVVQIYKKYVEEFGKLEFLTDDSYDKFIIHFHSFEVIVADMTDTSITTTNQYVGESSDN